jgi:hypothetical protein
MILLHVSWGVSVEAVKRDDKLELLILASARPIEAKKNTKG